MPKAILERLQVGVVVQNARSEILYVNPKACELLGLTRDQFLGKTSFDPDWNVIHRDGRPMPGETHPVPQAIRTKQPVQGVVMGVYRPSSRDRVWILVDALPELDSEGNVVEVTATFTDISAQIHLEASLQGLLMETGGISGEGFFAALVRQVAAVTGVAHVVIAQKHGKQLTTLAVWADGRLQPNLSYDIAGTPCARVLTEGFYACHENLQGHFPEDAMLGHLQSQAYVGVALQNQQGEAIGHLCLLHRQPLSPPVLAHIESVLRLFAQRAAAELERQTFAHRFQSFMDNLPALAYCKDAEGKVLYVNRYCAEVLGCRPTDIIGRSFLDILGDKAAILLEHDREVIRSQQAQVFEENPADIPCLSVKFPMDNGGVGGISIDIRDRRRAEHALAESEERRRLALELTNTGSWEFEVATGTVLWSDSHYRLMGLVPGSVAPGYAAWCERVHPDDWPTVEEALQGALRDGTLLDVEYRVVWPDGTERWVQTKGQGLYNAAGEPQKMVGVMMDISDRVAAQRALQASEERYRQIVELQTEFIVRSTPDTRLTFANHAFAEALGRSPQAVLGVSWASIVSPEEMRVLADKVAQLSPERPIFESQNGLMGGNGQRLLTEWVNRGLFNEAGELQEIQSVGRDVTALRNLEHRLKLTLQAARMAIWEVDWPAQRVKLLSYLPDDLLETGSDFQEFSLDEFVGTLSAEGEAIAHRLIAELLSNPQRHQFDLLVQSRTRSGILRWQQVLGEAQRDEQGRLLGALGVTIDVHDRHLMERSLQESEERLQRILQLNQIGTWEWERVSGRLYWNSQVYDLLGISPDIPASYEAFLQQVHPEDVPIIAENVRRAWESGTPYHVEYRVIKNQEERWLLAKAEVVHQGDRPERMVGILLDITERKRIEEELRERLRQEEVLNRLGQALRAVNRPEAVYAIACEVLQQALDVDRVEVNRYIAAQEQWVPQWEKRRHEGIPSMIGQVIPDRDNPLADRLKRGETVCLCTAEVTDPVNRALAEKVPGTWLVVPLVVNGAIWGALAANLHQTQRLWQPSEIRLAQQLVNQTAIALQQALLYQELQAERAFLNSIYQGAETSIFVMDVDDTGEARYVGLNPATECCTGKTTAEVQGKTLGELPDLFPHLPEKYRQCLAEKQSISYEIQTQFQNQTQWWWVTLNPLLNDRGKVYRIIGSAIDISDRKALEASLQENLERFQQLLDNVPTIVYRFLLRVDGSQAFTYLSENVAEVYELSHEVGMQDESQMRGRLHPDDRGRVLETTVASAETLTPWNCEFRIVVPSGKIKWLVGRSRPQRLPNGDTHWNGVMTDITDLKNTELALRESEAKLQAFLNNSPAIIYLKDREGRYQWVNREFEQVLQMPATTVCGQTDFDFLPPEIAQSIRAHDLQAMESRQAIHTEETAVVGDGQPHTYFVTKFPLLDAQGEPYALAGISIDITERKRAELELKRQKQFITQIAESTLAILYIYDLIEQRNVFVNPEVATVLGYTVEEIQAFGSHLFAELIHPDDLPRILENVHQNLRQNAATVHTVEVEYRMRHKNGSWRWLLSRDRVFAYTEDGTPKQILGVATDITYLKEIQFALQESENRFRAIANNLPGAVLRYVLHPDGTDGLQYISPGCAKLWEIAPEEALADVGTLWRLVAPEDLPSMQVAIVQSATTLTTWRCEWRIQTPRGQQKWLSGIGEPQRHPNGDVIWDTIILDVTDRKRSQAELEALVAERTESLLASQKFLRQQLEREKLLLAVTNRIRTSMDLPDILDRTVAEIQSLLGCDRVLIYRLLGDGSGVTIAEARVPAYSSFLGIAFKAEVLPESVQREYRQGRVAALNNSQGLSPCMVEFMERYQIRSKLVVPLIVGEDLWGLAVMQHCAQEHSWEEWEIDLMTQLSVSLAVAIRQSELFEQVQNELRARRQAEAALQAQAAADRLLAEIAQRIVQSPYLRDVLDSTLETLRQFLQVDRVVVYRFLPNWSGIIECEAVSHPDWSLAGQEIHDPCFEHKAIQQRYLRGEVDAVADVRAQSDRCYQSLMEQLGVRAKLVAPILQENSLWGLVIAHDCQKARWWTPQESRLLAQVAIQIGIAGQKEALFTRIEQELQQKETLLKEVHHRVKNNLQIVTSLMRLQVDRHSDEPLRSAFLEGQNRIQTMALIHERLYRSTDLSRIDAYTYFAELTQYLGQTYNAGDRRIVLQVDIATITLSIDQAIPCGLIVNELVSNALKYAFGAEGGIITVSLHPTSEGLCLRIADNGCGLPPDRNGQQKASLGLRLVERLVRQLSGSLVVEAVAGTTFTICFPWQP